MNDIFHRWNHHSLRAERYLVLPDGCRDVLILRRPGAADGVTLTDFDLCPRAVITGPGARMTGYRLRPGAVLCRDALAAIAANPDQAGAIIADACGAPGDLEHVITALSAPGATIPAVARTAGVSIRTLQRQFRAKDLPPPDFWRLLARARRAALMLAEAAPLAEIACTCGFSDQAHMSREFARWFGASPARLRADSAILNMIAQPALGAWTGEQISTR